MLGVYETNSTDSKHMKLVKIIALTAAAAGTFLATSCCNSKPAPTAPGYVAPAK
jgi:hypothetical protein